MFSTHFRSRITFELCAVIRCIAGLVFFLFFAFATLLCAILVSAKLRVVRNSSRSVGDGEPGDGEPEPLGSLAQPVCGGGQGALQAL